MARAVGVDFGTTNSAIAILDEGHPPRLARFASREGETTTFRSILHFERDPAGGALRAAAGPRAIDAYMESEEEGRLVQSLKSFLASRLFSSTNVLGSAYRLEALIALILSELREAAEAQFGPLGDRVVVGRPVRFAEAQSDDDDALALARLEASFHNAGYREVVFEYEPVAAAYFYESQLDHDELIAIADFGGGTSDFSLLRVGPAQRASGAREEALLGTGGIPIAGDCFDGRMVRQLVAPRLGMGSEYRSMFGRMLRVPGWIYTHLQRWNHLSFLKTPRTLQILYDLRREAVESDSFEALIHLVQNDLGFQLYRSVEQSKLELSAAEHARFVFSDPPVEISEGVERGAFEAWIADDLAQIETCLDSLLEEAGLGTGDVDRVFMTGGSSFVPAVRELFARRFGKAKLRYGNELTSVANGLALRARELAPPG